MSGLILIAFLLACLWGAIAAWRARPEHLPSLARVLPILCSAGVAGAISVAAEAGSASARYLGLLAVLLASAALTGGVIAARRTESAARKSARP